MSTRKEYGRKSSRATKKARTSKKSSPTPALSLSRLSRAKTLAGQKRALQRENTRLAKERFLAEKATRETRKAKREGRSPKNDAGLQAMVLAGRVARKALVLTRQHVIILKERIAQNTDGQADAFQQFLERPDIVDITERVHEGREDLNSKLGERVTEYVNQYLDAQTLPGILAQMDAAASRIGSYDVWNVTVFLFTDGKTEISYPTPLQGAGAFQATYEASGMFSSWADARASMLSQLQAFIRDAKGLLYVSYFIIFSSSPGRRPRTAMERVFRGLLS